MVICIIRDCDHDGSPQKDAVKCQLFQFPPTVQDSASKLPHDVFKVWLILCRVTEEEVKFVEAKICSCHFKNQDKNNLPTIFPWTNNKHYIWPQPSTSMNRKRPKQAPLNGNDEQESESPPQKRPKTSQQDQANCSKCQKSSKSWKLVQSLQKTCKELQRNIDLLTTELESSKSDETGEDSSEEQDVFLQLECDSDSPNTTAAYGPGLATSPVELGGLSAPKSVHWNGTLEWKVTSHSQGGEQQPTMQSLSCGVSQEGPLDAQIDMANWPRNLKMNLMPLDIITPLRYLFKNARILCFTFTCNDTEAFLSLYNAMRSGFAGCVYILATAPCDIKACLMLYRKSDRKFMGLIPADQPQFIKDLKAIVTECEVNGQQQQDSEIDERPIYTEEENTGGQESDEDQLASEDADCRQRDDMTWLKPDFLNGTTAASNEKMRADSLQLKSESVDEESERSNETTEYEAENLQELNVHDPDNVGGETGENTTAEKDLEDSNSESSEGWEDLECTDDVEVVDFSNLEEVNMDDENDDALLVEQIGNHEVSLGCGDLSLQQPGSLDENSEDNAQECFSDDETSSEQLVKWHSLTKHIEKPTFSGPTPGPVHDLSATATEQDYFELFFPAEMYDKIATFTNESIKRNKDNSKQVGRTNCPEITAEDIKAYLAIRMIMAVNHRDVMSDYWSDCPVLMCSLIKESMPRNQFKVLHRNFCVSDPSTSNADHLREVRDLYNCIKGKVQGHYNLHQDVSICEALINGHTKENAAVGQAFKVFVLIDSETGFLANFDVLVRSQMREQSRESLSENLIGHITGCNHILYTEKGLTTVPLAVSLLQKDTHLCGTFNLYRKHWPRDMKPSFSKKETMSDFSDLGRGSAVFRQSADGQIVATLWQDKTLVANLSTCFSPVLSEDDIVLRRQKKKQDGLTTMQYTALNCPEAIRNYSKFMRSYEMAKSDYSLQRPSSTWWTYLVWFLVDLALTNASLVMKSVHPKTVRRLFQVAVAKQLLGGYSTRKRHETKRVGPSLSMEMALSHRSVLASTGKCRTCRQCSLQNVKSNSGRTRATKYMCVQCGVYLHVDCFAAYHDHIMQKASKKDFGTQTESNQPIVIYQMNTTNQVQDWKAEDIKPVIP